MERFKARIAARGFSQIYEEDYTDTFAPTVRIDKLRVFLVMVAAENSECRLHDIKNASTEATLKEKNIFTYSGWSSSRERVLFTPTQKPIWLKIGSSRPAHFLSRLS